jgi:hypothetical protein
MFRLIEKMARESADTISDIHGGGSLAIKPSLLPPITCFNLP